MANEKNGTVFARMLEFISEIHEMASSMSFTDRHNLADRSMELIKEYKENRASPDEVASARELYADDLNEIDDDAMVSRSPDGDGLWVQGWLWIQLPEKPTMPDDKVKVLGLCEEFENSGQSEGRLVGEFVRDLVCDDDNDVELINASLDEIAATALSMKRRIKEGK